MCVWNGRVIRAHFDLIKKGKKYGNCLFCIWWYNLCYCSQICEVVV